MWLVERYMYTEFSPRIIQGITGGHGLGMAYGHIKSPFFPTSKKSLYWMKTCRTDMPALHRYTCNISINVGSWEGWWRGRRAGGVLSFRPMGVMICCGWLLAMWFTCQHWWIIHHHQCTKRWSVPRTPWELRQGNMIRQKPPNHNQNSWPVAVYTCMYMYMYMHMHM